MVSCPGLFQTVANQGVLARDFVAQIKKTILKATAVLGIRMRRVCLAQKNIRKYASVVATCSVLVRGAGDEI